MKEAIKKIKAYKQTKADIKHIEILIQELEEDLLGISPICYEEKTGPTYKISSSVEAQADIYIKEKEVLLKTKAAKERIIKRIDNALTVLNETEKDIINTILIEGGKYSDLEEKLNRTYSRIKQIEYEAINKIKRYL